MDRFKFRYFNKLSNKMVEPKNWQNIDSIFECLKQQVCYDNDISLLPYNHIGNGLVFMQCTGLKDKNGKLIYEGDICEYEFDDIGKQKAIIYFNKKYASFMVKPIDNFQYAVINDCEVIGNIYENPELLKKVKEFKKEALKVVQRCKELLKEFNSRANKKRV